MSAVATFLRHAFLPVFGCDFTVHTGRPYREATCQRCALCVFSELRADGCAVSDGVFDIGQFREATASRDASPVARHPLPR